MRTRHDHNTRDFLFALSVGFVLLLLLVHLGGCATQRSNVASSSSPTSVRTTTSLGHVVIRVRIVDTDPSDDVSLSFVYVCSRIVELMRGEPVQTND